MYESKILMIYVLILVLCLVRAFKELKRIQFKKRKKNKNALSSLSDIKPGDYVVHQSHGIGMYAGIQRLEVQGAIKDYLKIQYSGSDVLYVPVTQLDLLSRYTAPGDEEKVKLAKLGGTEWQRTRAKVKKATEGMTVAKTILVKDKLMNLIVKPAK